MKHVQLDKENTLIPSTPAQQLKTPALESFNQTRNNKNPSVSPSKRLPFASKDNNASVTKNLFSSIVKQPLEKPFQQNNNNNNNNNNNILNNKKRLKKYGSILGHSGQSLSLRNVPSIQLPRTKSLVLKDPSENPDSESESGSDEDWGHNPFQLKLQNALKNAQEASSPTKAAAQIVENEIEYKSEPIDEFPYIPDGYTPFTQEDFSKLSEYYPYDVLVDGTIVKETNNDELTNKHVSPTLLPLELNLEQEESDDNNLSKTQMHNSKDHPMTMTHNDAETSSIELLPLDLEYNGEGLNDSDIIDLIDSI